jgi:hypothetical protein
MWKSINLLVAADDFSRIHPIPIFWGFNGVGHEGTFWSELNGGGIRADRATAWFSWRLKGDSSAGRMFEGADCGLCTNTRWTVQKKLMD